MFYVLLLTSQFAVAAFFKEMGWREEGGESRRAQAGPTPSYVLTVVPGTTSTGIT
jgi:hypothetical protein